MTLFANAPYYSGYKNFPSLFPQDLVFSSSQILNPANVIEVVTSPNNPDGNNRTNFYPTQYTIYDSVYYWPLFTTIYQPLNKDIMLFSLSKLSGHAGTQVGWAFVKNPAIANLMNTYLSETITQVSNEQRLRAAHIINEIIYLKSDFSYYITNKLKYRWSVMTDIFSSTRQSRFTIQSPVGQYFVWIQCNIDLNCYNTFYGAKINTFAGELFGAAPGVYVRLHLVSDDSTFNLMVINLKLLTNYN